LLYFKSTHRCWWCWRRGVAPCRLVNSHRLFGETIFFHVQGLLQGDTNYRKMWELLQNYSRRKSDIKQTSYWGHTDIRRLRTNLVARVLRILQFWCSRGFNTA
jgi:hypothetical protein